MKQISTNKFEKLAQQFPLPGDPNLPPNVTHENIEQSAGSGTTGFIKDRAQDIEIVVNGETFNEWYGDNILSPGDNLISFDLIYTYNPSQNIIDFDTILRVTSQNGMDLINTGIEQFDDARNAIEQKIFESIEFG